MSIVPFSKVGAELLFEVVSRAYERQSLIVTTNLPFENWTEVMGSERLTGALLDWLTHRVHIIQANGENWHGSKRAGLRWHRFATCAIDTGYKPVPPSNCKSVTLF